MNPSHTDWWRVISGNTAHLARASDRTGMVLCGEHKRNPSGPIDNILEPGRPSSTSLCPACVEKAGQP